MLEILFHQHLQPALRAIPAVLLFLLCSIPLGFSASAYVLLYTVARSNTHLKRPLVLSSPLADGSSSNASSSTGRAQLSGPPLVSWTEGNIPPENNSFQEWEGSISNTRSMWWITYLLGAGLVETPALMFFRVSAAPHFPKPLPHPEPPPLTPACFFEIVQLAGSRLNWLKIFWKKVDF